ncbi:hypothetical protein ACVFI8_10905 [Agarivorans sp. MS3-6]
MEEVSKNDVDSAKSIAKPFGLTLKNLLVELDWSLGRTLARMFGAFTFITIILFGALTFVSVLNGIFEYETSLSEISTIEAVFSVSFILMLKRYYNYTKLTSQHWGLNIVTPFIWLGKFSLFIWLLFSLLMFDDISKGATRTQVLLLQTHNYQQWVEFLGILLSLYISVPSKRLKFRTPDPETYNADEWGIKRSNTTCDKTRGNEQ